MSSDHGPTWKTLQVQCPTTKLLDKIQVKLSIQKHNNINARIQLNYEKEKKYKELKLAHKTEYKELKIA